MIRTPYPELTIDTDERARVILEWTAANVRAQREYALHPIAACTVTGCYRLVTAPAGGLCRSHCHIPDRQAA